MADFNRAYEKTLQNEGGYSDDKNDTGGETYKGISRNNFPSWEGWVLIDGLKQRLGFSSNIDTHPGMSEMVKKFYYNEFWLKINGNQYKWQEVAESVFDFSVNAGVVTASKLAQRVVGVKEDGIISTGSLSAINAMEPRLFVALFAVEKCRKYCKIVDNNTSQLKYLKGWVWRSIKDVK